MISNHHRHKEPLLIQLPADGTDTSMMAALLAWLTPILTGRPAPVVSPVLVRSSIPERSLRDAIERRNEYSR